MGILGQNSVSDLGGFEQAVSEIHSRHLPFGLPLGTPKGNDLIVHDIYALSSSDETKFASWVALGRFKVSPFEAELADLEREIGSHA